MKIKSKEMFIYETIMETIQMGSSNYGSDVGDKPNHRTINDAGCWSSNLIFMKTRIDIYKGKDLGPYFFFRIFNTAYDEEHLKEEL